MRRRALLSAVGTGVLAGCLDDGPIDDRPTPTPDPGATGSATRTMTPASGAFERCNRVVIDEGMLPPELAAEVDAALANGEYVAETVHLEDAIDTDVSYVRVDGTYYDPTVESAEGGQRLTLSAVETPRLPEERSVRVSNETSTEREIRVTVDDGALLDETVRLAENEREQFPVTDAFGTYELTATAGDETETYDWQINESSFDAEVWYGNDGLSVTQAVADLAPCPWVN